MDFTNIRSMFSILWLSSFERRESPRPVDLKLCCLAEPNETNRDLSYLNIQSRCSDIRALSSYSMSTCESTTRFTSRYDCVRNRLL